MCGNSIIGYVPRGEVTPRSLQLIPVTAIAHVATRLRRHVATLYPVAILTMPWRQRDAKVAHHRLYFRAAACPDAVRTVHYHQPTLFHACKDVERSAVACHGQADVTFHIRLQPVLVNDDVIGSKPTGHSLQDGHVLVNAVG